LIEVLKSMPGDESQRGNDATDFNNKLSYLHEQLAEEVSVSPAKADDIKLLTVLGRGSFGTVYLGEWRGAAVAVKRIVLPAAMSNSERAQKMAVMEIAISSSMCHPNLVQTYTYSIKQLRDQEYDDGVKLIGGSGSHVNAHEVSLESWRSALTSSPFFSS
jgi:serine/threonine protein kinase